MAVVLIMGGVIYYLNGSLDKANREIGARTAEIEQLSARLEENQIKLKALERSKAIDSEILREVNRDKLALQQRLDETRYSSEIEVAKIRSDFERKLSGFNTTDEVAIATRQYVQDVIQQYQYQMLQVYCGGIECED